MAERAPSPAAQRVGRDLPSWLVSCVVHLALLLLLALLVSQAPHGDLLSLQADFSGGESPSAAGLDSVPAVEIAAASLPELAPQAVDLASLESAASTSGLESLGAALDGAEREGLLGEQGLDLGLSSAQTSIFGLAEEASSFVYVFDRSESMNSRLSYQVEGRTMSITPLEAAKAELLRSLGDLDPRQRFQLIFYNHEPVVFGTQPGAPRLLPATGENKRRAATFVGRMPGEGGTYHFQPLQAALRLAPESIFLMTDGQQQDDPTPVELAEIKRQNRHRSRINVILFYFLPRPAGALEQLAQENRGQFVGINLSQIGRGASGAGGGPLGAQSQRTPRAAGPLVDLRATVAGGP